MKRWFKYIKPYLSSFILGPTCMIIELIGDVFMPILLAWIINSAEDGTLTIGNSIGIAMLMIGIILVMLVGGVGGAYFGSKASVNFATDLRRDVYAKIQKFSFANIDKFSAGSLVTRMTNDVTQLQNFVNMLLRMALRSPGMMIGGIIMAITLKPSLSVVLAVTMPMMILVILLLIKIGFPRFGKMQEKLDKLNASLKVAENMGGSDGIGLRNVNYRLKNIYGDAYGINIESELGVYTRVNMKIRYTVHAGEEKVND